MAHTHNPFIFGEVLFDRFPDGHIVLGGAPFNVAWHLQAFGQAPTFISRVGDDPLGRRIRGAMQAWELTTAGLQLDSRHPTGTVEVTFNDGEPAYDIVFDRAYDHIDGAGLPPGTPSLLYHGTLALRGSESRRALETLKTTHDMPIFVDVNLRPPWWDVETTHSVMSAARWVKLNADELALLMDPGKEPERSASELLQRHDLELLIVTRGAQGAMVMSREGQNEVVEPPSAQPVVDTVGAGDAFSSAFVLGLMQRWPLKLTLERAQDFASAVVGVRGATVQDKGFYQPFLDQWGLSES